MTFEITDVTPNVVTAMRAARAKQQPDELIRGVKRAVADELGRLDPTLKFEMTSYFNHSYVPDMVAKWAEDGAKRERRIFIRGSLTSLAASEDAVTLSDQMPLLIGVGQEQKSAVRALRKQLPETTRTLATDIAATAAIPSANSGADASQLSGLVRANIVRDGRGVLGESAASRIAEVEDNEPDKALSAFKKTVSSLFTGTTAERLNRTATLLTEFFDATPSREVLQQLRDESLSDAELSIVLPFVLGRSKEVQSQQVWDALASMLTLERIESLSPVLTEFDLTQLVRPALNELIAARSALFVNASEVDDEEKDQTSPRWGVRNGRLVADVRRWSLWFGSDTRKIKGRDDGPDARWDELSAPLRAFDLVAVDLRGLSRQLGLANESASGVTEDVESVRASIRDDFHVASATVRERGEEDSPPVKVVFAASTATGKAPVDFHVRAASLLSVKRPIAARDLAELVVTIPAISPAVDTYVVRVRNEVVSDGNPVPEVRQLPEKPEPA